MGTQAIPTAEKGVFSSPPLFVCVMGGYDARETICAYFSTNTSDDNFPLTVYYKGNDWYLRDCRAQCIKYGSTVLRYD